MSSKIFNIINNRMSLRKPQEESLEILEKILNKITLTKEYNNEELLPIVHKIAGTCTDFERNFPSICFSLATGVGKTRLMGAFMAYLYKEKNIKNFMVIAPNLTIYNKLIKDFGDTSYEKYVFKGIPEFYQANIITGENYKKNIESQISISDITINIFNISKINAETKGGKEPQIKRLSEYIGDSYFNYLASREDLVILMDESHHYRADRGMQVLNELNPVLGLELTATPQIEKGNKTIKFKNVVYEYSLAKAIKDGFVKVPYVATRKNFNVQNYRTDLDKDIVKLEDGIRLHENTKVILDIYARDNHVRRVKPFVLVVAKDTTHAEELLNIIKSENFFNGKYADKVIIVHSNQSGTEKDENIAQLISLEDYDNKIEIVIHVNMLKEGWDVNNLYTIVPLRTSASSTLTEQTIGRGLRLPYGKITGNEVVDKLTIVSHDKYDEIIREANKETSIVKQENVIDIEDLDIDEPKEVITIANNFTSELTKEQEDITQKLNWRDDSESVNRYLKTEAKKQIYNAVFEESAKYGASSVASIDKEAIKEIVINNLNKANEGDQVQIEGFNDGIIQKIEENFEEIIKNIDDNTIEIPRITIYKSTENNVYFEDFDLNTNGLNLRPDEGKIITTNLSNTTQTTEIVKSGRDFLVEDPEHTLVSLLWNKPEVDYDKSSVLLFKLSNQAVGKLKSYLNDDEVISVIKERKSQIVDYIYSQMKEHLIIEDSPILGKDVRPFVRIEEQNYSKILKDDLLSYTQTVEAKDLKKKVFTGFTKACHSAYKFDSIPEKDLVTCLENDNNVIKWLRPAFNQFNIMWNRAGERYEPDFIVETTDTIYMIEIKRDDQIYSDEVQKKKEAALKYCEDATEYNKSNGKKEWKYIIIPGSEVKFNRTMKEYENLFRNRF